MAEKIVEKHVLVCLGERRREVVFNSNGNIAEEKKSLLIALREAYNDVSQLHEDAEIVLQVKSEAWGGEFIDIKEEMIMDKSVIKVFLEPSRINKITGTAKKLCKPSMAEAKVLGKLFPSSSSQKRSFDPTSGCCVKESQKKKKASGSLGRPTNVQVVILPKFMFNLPRGKHRTLLKKAGRILSLQFKRSMTSLETRNQILRGFKEIGDLDTWTVLETADNRLVIAKDQALDGEAVVNRKGSLYLCQAKSLDSSSGNAKKQVVDKDVSSSDDDLPQVNVRTNKDNPIILNSDDEIPVQSTPQQYASSSGTIPRALFNSPATSSGSPDVVLPVSSESLTNWRALRRQQDQDYQQTLAIDEEKSLKLSRELERKERLHSLRIHLRDKFGQQEYDVGVKVSVRLMDSSKIERYFNPKDTTQMLYEFVFLCSEDDSPFCVCTCYPRGCVSCSSSESLGGVDLSSLLVVEKTGEDLVDPIKLLPVSVEVSCLLLGDCDVYWFKWDSCKSYKYCKPGDFIMSEPTSKEPKEKVTAELKSLKKAENTRRTFMESLKLPLTNGIPHRIERSKIYTDVIALYSQSTASDDLFRERPFRIKFEGEKAFDIGGVTREMFSAFYEETYVKLFDGPSLLTPLDFPNTASSPLHTLGAIISHGYLIAGVLPVKIAFPSLCAILMPNASSIPDEVLVQSFIDSLSYHEASIIVCALVALKDNLDTFPPDTQTGLVNTLSRFGVREFPKPDTFMNLITDIAKYHFLRKPAVAIAEIRSGIPKVYTPFWDKMGMGELYNIYKALQASASKVLALLEEPVMRNENQERVYGYLQQYIGNMQGDEPRMFLRYVTGTAVCSSHAINITFNSLDGLARRPIGHTCSNTLELSAAYVSYLDFASEFKTILSNMLAWKMDAI